MQTPTANIFDLLLGPTDPASVDLSVLGQATMPEGQVFGDLMARLLADPGLGLAAQDGRSADALTSNAITDPADPLPSVAALLEQFLANPDGETSEDLDPLSKQPTKLVFADTPGLQPGGANARLSDLVPEVVPQEPKATGAVSSDSEAAIAATGASVRDQNVLAFNRELRSLLPETIKIDNPTLQAVMHGRPVAIDDGTYKIVSSSQSEQSINLEIIADEDTPSVRISLPLDKLTIGRSEAAPSVTFNDDPSQKALLSALLKKLRLTDLTVTRSTDHADNAARTTAEITIAGQNQSGETKVTAQVASASLIGLTMSPSPRERAGKTPEPTVKSDGPVSPTDSPESQATKSKIATADDASRTDATLKPSTVGTLLKDLADPSQRRGFATLDDMTALTSDRSQSNGHAAESTNVRPEVAGFDTGATPRAVATQSGASPSPVRFHIPNDAGQFLKSSRHSIQIRIEPEHLGPARLSISTSGETIRAHLVVDSAEAKALVESRLDQLTRQLDKANVKFDHIDVSVAGDDTAHRFHERHPRRPIARRMPRLDKGSIDLETPTAMTEVTAPAGHLGSQSVNLLA